jgi:hypothetical protein
MDWLGEVFLPRVHDPEKCKQVVAYLSVDLSIVCIKTDFLSVRLQGGHKIDKVCRQCVDSMQSPSEESVKLRETVLKRIQDEKVLDEFFSVKRCH